MKAEELQKALEDYGRDDDPDHDPNVMPLTAAALIEWTSRGGAVHRGIALCIGETIAREWQSGDVIVFWSSGDHTMLVGGEIEIETEIKVIRFGDGFNLFDRRLL
jgi:hypothetical protein